jgi:hypothetical protein
MTRNVLTLSCLHEQAPALTLISSRCSLPIKIDACVMSVAWSQKTVKGLGAPGNRESADPYTESGEKRARV